MAAARPCASCAYRLGRRCVLHDDGTDAYSGGCSGHVPVRRITTEPPPGAA